MPSPGVSLVGFIANQQDAINHLMVACMPSVGATDATLIAEWQTAKAKLGPPMANAGNPSIQPLPAAQKGHANQILAEPVFQTEWAGATINMVEIAPLLAHQITVDSNRSGHHCGSLSAAPTTQELMDCCLPLAQQQEETKLIPGQNSLLIKARSLNVRILQGVGQAGFLGIQVGVSIPYVHVVRLNGRHYLFNGYHRAVGLRSAGVTHMPCVLRDVPDHAAIGLNPPNTFSAALLDSSDPPTIEHMVQHGCRVSLRHHSRVLYVNWAEHAVPDE
jgi:hypothetical protein